MKRDFKIRPYRKEDAQAAFDVCASIPELAPWTLADFENVLEAGYEGWLAESNGRVAAFIITRRAADELEIHKLGTAPEFRRRGVGSGLLTAAFVAAASHGVKRAFLEVRASNSPAIALYQAAGFAVVGRRRGYYRAPVEDALLMSCSLERKNQIPIGG